MFPDNSKDKKNITGDDHKKTATKVADVSDLDSQPNFGNLKSNSMSGPNSNLIQIKQKALEQVSNLIDTLEQPPEQLFRTVMMIIQETDNSSLLDKAYETALQIKDEKGRAEALLTVANEINYFTNK